MFFFSLKVRAFQHEDISTRPRDIRMMGIVYNSAFPMAQMVLVSFTRMSSSFALFLYFFISS